MSLNVPQVYCAACQQPIDIKNSLAHLGDRWGSWLVFCPMCGGDAQVSITRSLVYGWKAPGCTPLVEHKAIVQRLADAMQFRRGP
jgi:hypothetical protein